MLTGRRMTDLALPAAAPIRTYAGDVVAALAELFEDSPAELLDGFDFAAQGTWTFVRPGSVPLRPEQSLDEAGVVDGSLLTPVAVSRTERYQPLVEDVIDAIAVLDQTPQFDRAALNRFVMFAVPVVAVLLVALATTTWWHTGHSPAWPIVMGAVGVITLAGSWFAARVYRNTSLSESLLATAVPIVTVAVALAVPPPRDADPIGAPQLAAAAATVMFLALVTRGGPRRRTELATLIAVLGLAAAGVAFAFGFGWQRWVPVGATLLGLFVVTNAAKLTVAVARIALPPIPAPGETVTNDELLDPVVGAGEPAGETAAWRAVIASVPNSALRLTERSALAKRLLVGFVAGGAVILSAGGVALLQQGHFFVHTLVLAALVTVVCAFRSRLYADRWCAWALLLATVAIPTGVLVRLTLWYPEAGWMLMAGYFGGCIVTLGIVAASRTVRRATPVTKRAMELADGAAIAAIIPMLLWVAGIYDIVRNLRH
ncbi:type VII secretion integral membrane protein EccD [Mycolicibacterium sp. S2-37]|nr:type VII secretion integral membrane protein EccD [Mycolicibacterium sp. S2-37]